MYPRDAASPQRIALGAVVQISDGAVQTSGVSVSVLPQGTTASAGGGTLAFEQGIAHYTPTQAETNYTSFIVIAYKTGSIPVSVTVVTSASATAGYAGVDWGFVANPTTAVNLSATNIDVDQVVASVTGAVGSVTGNVGGNVTGSVGSVASGGITAASLAADAITAAKLAADVTTELQSGLATASALSTVAGYLDTEIAAIMAVTDKLDDTLEDNGGTYRFTINALAQAPSGGGGGSTDWTADERTAIRAILGIPGSGTTPADPTTGILDAIRNAVLVVDDFVDTEVAAILAAVDTEIAAIKAKTDNLPSDPADASVVAGLIAAVETKVDTAITDIAAVPTAIENADALLARDIGSGTGAGTLNERTVRSALRFLRNKWSISGTTLTVTKENDSDTSHTATVTPTTGADPVTGVDPS